MALLWDSGFVAYLRRWLRSWVAAVALRAGHGRCTCTCAPSPWCCGVRPCTLGELHAHGVLLEAGWRCHSPLRGNGQRVAHAIGCGLVCVKPSTPWVNDGGLDLPCCWGSVFANPGSYVRMQVHVAHTVTTETRASARLLSRRSHHLRTLGCATASPRQHVQSGQERARLFVLVDRTQRIPCINRSHCSIPVRY